MFSLNFHRRAIQAQPRLPLLPVRQHLVHLVPEGVGVVAVVGVAEFVDGDVVDDGGRGHQALPVEA